MLPAGLLTEVHPASRNLPGTKPVVFMRAVPITALGTWRIVTAFPIIPQQDSAMGTGSYGRCYTGRPTPAKRQIA